jgi:acyl-CoA synthetase (AMP-forming)/AMP-acid ligase II
MLHIFLSNRAGEVKYGTTGKPVPGYDIRLVDDDGKIVTTRGEMGELQVRGPTGAVMYWNNREQSRATFLGEWTRSGDKYIEDETAISSTAAGATTCSRSAACMSRRSRSRRRCKAIPTCSKPPSSAGRTSTA